MRGPVGSDVLITVVREGLEEPIDITITRDTIKLTAARVRQEGDSVVIRVATFNEQTCRRCATACPTCWRRPAAWRASTASCSTCATTPAAC